jgi:hypothetical protein
MRLFNEILEEAILREKTTTEQEKRHIMTSDLEEII